MKVPAFVVSMSTILGVPAFSDEAPAVAPRYATPSQLNAVAAISAIDIQNIAACTAEIRRVQQLSPKVPTFAPYTTNYSKLMVDLRNAAQFLPLEYQVACSTPLIQRLERMGSAAFSRIFNSGSVQTNEEALLKEMIPDIVMAVLFRAMPTYAKDSKAFQEVVSDLYQGFLSEEKRVSKETGQQIKPPDLEILPPLIKWGNPEAGPYTWPADATVVAGLKGVSIVSLPQELMLGGVVAWGALPHETAGHDVLHADNGLLDELASKIKTAIIKKFTPTVGSQRATQLGNLFSSWTDEAASDVAGILNAGPSSAMALISYFRALNQDGKLSSIGSKTDPHPIDILRAFMAAKVVYGMNFSQRTAWMNVIFAEANKDLRSLSLYDENTGRTSAFPVDTNTAVQAAYLTADVIANTKLTSLEGHSLREIQDWTDSDQTYANELGSAIASGQPIPAVYKGAGLFAVHAVAGAIQESLKKGANIQAIFAQMKAVLGQMNQDNPVWNPMAPKSHGLSASEPEAAEMSLNWDIPAPDAD